MNGHLLLRSHRFHVDLLDLVIVEQFVLGLWIVRFMDPHPQLVMIQREVAFILLLLEHS